MGNSNNPLRALISTYTEDEAIKDPQQTLGIKIYYKKSKADYVLIDKDMRFEDVGFGPESLAAIEKRAEKLPEACMPGIPEYSKRVAGSIEVKFLIGSMNLNDYVLMQKYRGKMCMQEHEVWQLMECLISFGKQLQAISEYHYLLNMSNVFVTAEGIKFQNPFIYKAYLTDSLKILGDLSWLQAPDQSKNKLTADERKYQSKLRMNVRQVGLIVLFTALHKHDTNLIDEQGDLDKTIIEVALDEFRAAFSKDLVSKVQSLIKLGSREAELFLFSDLLISPNPQKSVFRVTNTESHCNFVSKLNGPGGFFYRNYDIPPHYEEIQANPEDVRTSFFLHPDVKVKAPENPKTQEEWSIVEQSIREERPNPYARRSVSPIDKPRNEDSKLDQTNYKNPHFDKPPPGAPQTPQKQQDFTDPHNRALSPPKEPYRPTLGGPSRGSLPTDPGHYNPNQQTQKANDQKTDAGYYSPNQTNKQPHLSDFYHKGMNGNQPKDPSTGLPLQNPRQPPNEKPNPQSPQNPKPEKPDESQDYDPLEKIHVQEEDAIYGKVEQMFRESRMTPKEVTKLNQTLKEGGKPQDKNQSTLNATLHNHHYTGMYLKNPDNFTFPVMNTNRSRSSFPSPLNLPGNQQPKVDPQTGLQPQKKPLELNTSSRKDAPNVGQIENVPRGPQTIYTVGKYGARAIGPEAFIPPLQQLPRYSKSKYNPFAGNNLYMHQNRQKYIQDFKAEIQNPQAQTQLVQNPPTLQVTQPLPSPQPPIVVTENSPRINFFTNQETKVPFTYSPSPNSRRRSPPVSPQRPGVPLLDPQNPVQNLPTSSPVINPVPTNQASFVPPIIIGGRRPAPDIYNPSSPTNQRSPVIAFEQPTDNKIQDEKEPQVFGVTHLLDKEGHRKDAPKPKTSEQPPMFARDERGAYFLGYIEQVRKLALDTDSKRAEAKDFQLFARKICLLQLTKTAT